MKEKPIEVEGCVQTVLPGTMFRVELDNKHLVLATICGKMRKRWVRLTVGDRVIKLEPYGARHAGPSRRRDWLGLRFESHAPNFGVTTCRSHPLARESGTY